jgi:hypothetical protein
MIFSGIGIIDSFFSAPPAPVEQLFTASGTWSCCPGTVCIEVIAVGGGGGGNGGGVCSSIFNNANAGGQGGAGGSFVIATLTGGQVPTSTCVIIGAAGSGAPATTTAGRGCQGTNGGDTCFGSCLVAGGGCAGDNGGTPPRLGGYVRVSYGGVNGCGGKPGVATITTGTGTATVGNCGGEMLATCFTPITELRGRDGDGGLVSGKGGGAGGAIGGNNAGTCCCGAGGNGAIGFTCCGITLGNGGNGAAAPNGAGSNATGYGAGGGGSSGALFCSPAAGNGGDGVLKVIQYFA